MRLKKLFETKLRGTSQQAWIRPQRDKNAARMATLTPLNVHSLLDFFHLLSAGPHSPEKQHQPTPENGRDREQSHYPATSDGSTSEATPDSDFRVFFFFFHFQMFNVINLIHCAGDWTQSFYSELGPQPLFFFFETGSYYITQYWLELVTFLPQTLKCWDCGHAV